MGQSRFQVKKITIKETYYKNKKTIVIVPIDDKAKNGDKTEIKLDFNEITKYKLGNSSTEQPEYVNIKDETLEKYHIKIYYEDKNIYLKNNNKKDDLWLRLPDSKEKPNSNSQEHLNVYLMLQKNVEIKLSGDYHITIDEVSDFIPAKECKYCGNTKITYYAMIRNCQHIIGCYQCKIKIDKCWICDCQIIEIDKVIVSQLN